MDGLTIQEEEKSVALPPNSHSKHPFLRAQDSVEIAKKSRAVTGHKSFSAVQRYHLESPAGDSI